jgi:histidinol dehydrogenase
VTDSESLLDATQGELSRQLQALPEPRRSYAMSALGDNGGCVLVGDLSEAAEVANAYAPEHMQLVVREDYEEAMLGRLEHAGEILVGQHTPIAAANYTIGVPAALPTGGFARVTSGVTAETFLKRTSIAWADAAALRSMAPAALALAAHEGFRAHAAAIRARLDEAG